MFREVSASVSYTFRCGVRGNFARLFPYAAIPAPPPDDNLECSKCGELGERSLWPPFSIPEINRYPSIQMGMTPPPIPDPIVRAVYTTQILTRVVRPIRTIIEQFNRETNNINNMLAQWAHFQGRLPQNYLDEECKTRNPNNPMCHFCNTRVPPDPDNIHWNCGQMLRIWSPLS